MQVFSATTPGKIILFGEHAVVYGRPALAAPVFAVEAKATVRPGTKGSGIAIEAPDIDQNFLISAKTSSPLSVASRVTLDFLNEEEPDVIINISSTIPIESGMGSGAAVTAALIAALGEALGYLIETQDWSKLVYEVEKVHHRNPSGIDNTVVCYAEPVYYVKGEEPKLFIPAEPLHLVIANTGIRVPTYVPVNRVRDLWKHDKHSYEGIFSDIGGVAELARWNIENGNLPAIGELMKQNQKLLRQLGVSSTLLNTLCDVAVSAGAYGAKLTGAGDGGNIVALVPPEAADRVQFALEKAGAVSTIFTTIRP